MEVAGKDSQRIKRDKGGRRKYRKWFILQFSVENPEKTFSRFPSDLVSRVKAVAFLSLKTTELQGLRLDIWGESCEIGGVEVTRLAFRLLDVNFVCSRLATFSVSQVSQFCFGKISLMNISLGIVCRNLTFTACLTLLHQKWSLVIDVNS